jgi:hypothetical protein
MKDPALWLGVLFGLTLSVVVATITLSEPLWAALSMILYNVGMVTGALLYKYMRVRPTYYESSLTKEERAERRRQIASIGLETDREQE